MIRERGEGPVDGVELARDRGGPARPGGARRRSRPRAPSSSARRNPVISIRPILEVARHRRDALRAADAPVVAVSPIVGGAGASRARPRPSWPGPGCRLDAAGIAQAYEGLLDGIVADEPVDGLPALRDRHAHGRRRPRAGASPSRDARASRSVWRAMSDRRRPAGQALRRRQAAPGPGARRAARAARWPRRWSPTCCIALRRARARRRGRRRDRRERAPRRWRAPTTPRRSPTTTAATRTRRAPASTGRSSAAPSACCSSPATAPRSTRARSTTLLAAGR